MLSGGAALTSHWEQLKQVGCHTRDTPAREAEMQMSPPTIESPHCNKTGRCRYLNILSQCIHIQLRKVTVYDSL